MDFFPFNYQDGDPLPLLPSEPACMTEPSCCMDQLYNSLNSYTDDGMDILGLPPQLPAPPTPTPAPDRPGTDEEQDEADAQANENRKGKGKRKRKRKGKGKGKGKEEENEEGGGGGENDSTTEPEDAQLPQVEEIRRPRPSPWRHRDVDNHLSRLGAGSYWPKPQVIDSDTAFEISEEWRAEVYDGWTKLDHLVRTRFDDVAFPIRSTGSISDEILLEMIEKAWETTTSKPLIRDVFGGTMLPEDPKSGYEAWADIFRGLVANSELPVPSYSVVPEGDGPEKFAELEAFVARHRVAFQIPILNLEQLMDRSLLLMLIVQRTVETPPYFARADWEAMQIGRAGRLLVPPFCDATFMIFLRARNRDTEWYSTDDPYEQGYSWGGLTSSATFPEQYYRYVDAKLGYGRILRTDGEKRDDWKDTSVSFLNQRGLVYGWSEGLLVLQTQATIYRFCLELAELSMAYCVKSKSRMLPLLPGWPQNFPGCRTSESDARFAREVNDAKERIQAAEGNIIYYRAPGDETNLAPEHNYHAKEVLEWKEASDGRIRAVGDAYPMRVKDQPEGNYQFGLRPTTESSNLHHNRLKDRSERLWMYFKKRTLSVLSSPQKFIAMCRDGYRFHYGWIVDDVDDKGAGGTILEHMTSTEFNAKKALANDVIRRCLRFLIFATEISYAVSRLVRALGKVTFPYGYLDGAYQAQTQDWCWENPVAIEETRAAYVTCVLNLRFLNETLFTHLHGQAVVHGLPLCRSLCRRDHVPIKRVIQKTFDKHGHRRYRPLPRGLRAGEPPSIPTLSSNAPLAQSSTGSSAEATRLLQDVERGPPSAQYGIPGIKAVATSILKRMDQISDRAGDDQPFGSTTLARDAAFVVSQLADLSREMEVPDPIASERYLLKSPATVETVKRHCPSHEVLDGLDDFNFEETVHPPVLDGVHKLLGVRYSNSDDTEVTIKEANERLAAFKDSLFSWMRGKKCFPKGLEASSGMELWNSMDALALGLEDVGPAETDLLRLRYVFGRIENEDVTLPRRQPTVSTVPPPLPGDPTEPSPPPNDATEPSLSAREEQRLALNEYISKYVERNTRGGKVLHVPEIYKSGNANVAAASQPQAQDRLSSRDWVTVDDTFGKAARQRGTIRWQHWETLFRHMGFKVTHATGGSAVKFEWTPASKLPEPTKKVSSVHRQHASGKSASIEAFRVHNWCNEFRQDFGITAELIEQCYGREPSSSGAAAGAAPQLPPAGPHVMAARIASDASDVDMASEGASDYEAWRYVPYVPTPGEEKIEIPGMRELGERLASEDLAGSSRKRKAPGLFDGLVKQAVEGEVDDDGEQLYRWVPKKVRFG